MLSLVSMSSNKIAEHIITNKMCIQDFPIVSSAIGEVEKDIMLLNLPYTLKEYINKLIPPVSYDINLYYYYMLMCDVVVNPNFLKKLIFTMEGKIDYRLSTRKLVLDRNVDITSRVTLACMFCFEEEVLAFWKIHPDILGKLAEQGRLTTLSKWLEYLETEELPEQFLWKDCVLLEAAFLAAVNDISLEALKYFWEKMVAMPNKKKISILETAKNLLRPAPLSYSLESSFIKDIEFFLLLSENEIRHIVFEKEMLIKKMYEILESKRELLKNKTNMFKNKTDMFKNKAEMFKNKCEMFTNKTQMGKNENEGLNNEREMLEIECEMLKNEYKMLLNEDEEIRKENELLMNGMD